MRLRNLTLSITLGAVITLGLVAALSFLTVPVAAQPAPAPAAGTIDYSEAISKALSYIHTWQQPDGGIDAFEASFGSDSGSTARAVLALVAAGRPATSMAHPTTGKTMVDFLETQAVSYTHSPSGTTSSYLYPTQAGLLLAAVSAANEDPTSFGRMDLIAELNDTYHPATGAYSTTATSGWPGGAAGATNQMWSILGLSAAGEPVPEAATDYLASLQDADGLWGFGMGGDMDTSAAALMALIGSGNVSPTDPVMQKSVAYFRANQKDSGGWAPSWDTAPANADTTALIIQALIAAGHTPPMEGWANPIPPQTALLNLQQADGSIGGAYVNAYSTIEALLGLTEQPLFFLGKTHRARRALTWVNEQQNLDGSWSSWGAPNFGGTCDAAIAYAAAGIDPYTVKASGSTTSAMDYLADNVAGATSADALGKLAVAVEAAGGDAHNFGGMDIVDAINATYSEVQGGFDDPGNVWHQSLAILGLTAAGEMIPPTATQTLIGLQDPSDGGWPYSTAWPVTSPDNTGLALQALSAAGVSTAEPSVISGVTYLQNTQNAVGSWNGFFGIPSANSTALAMQGLLAAGEDLDAAKWMKDGISPYSALTALQKVDGPFADGGLDDGLSTWQAVPALLGRSLPLQHAGEEPFTPFNRGPDPDRLVAVAPRFGPGNSVAVTIPFGSDLNANGSVELEWRLRGAASWSVATTYRADGYFTATLPIEPTEDYEWRAFLTDPEGVQYGATLYEELEIPFHAYVPAVCRW